MRGLSIIVPCYNEASRGDFESRVRKLARCKGKMPFACELVFVDDGSEDETEKILTNQNQKVFSLLENRGKYIALQYGIALCKYDTVLMLDADLEVAASDIINAYSHIERYPVIVGYRTEEDKTLFRSLLSKISKIFSKYIMKISVRDTQCGYKMFRKEVYGKIKGNLVCHKYLWDMDFLMEVQRRNIPVMEVSISAKGIKKSSFKPLLMVWGSVKEIKKILRKGKKL